MTSRWIGRLISAVGMEDLFDHLATDTRSATEGQVDCLGRHVQRQVPFFAIRARVTPEGPLVLVSDQKVLAETGGMVVIEVTGVICGEYESYQFHASPGVDCNDFLQVLNNEDDSCYSLKHDESPLGVVLANIRT